MSDIEWVAGSDSSALGNSGSSALGSSAKGNSDNSWEDLQKTLGEFQKATDEHNQQFLDQI